jgi:uncharacterized membrane protein YdbT with pleckstrin-like domain
LQGVRNTDEFVRTGRKKHEAEDEAEEDEEEEDEAEAKERGIGRWRRRSTMLRALATSELSWPSSLQILSACTPAIATPERRTFPLKP